MLKIWGEMFANCYDLTSVDISDFAAYSIKNMGYMFEGCISLISIDISKFDIFRTRMKFLFSQCYSLTTIKFPTNTFYPD